jgi:hypothetical protein
MIYIKNRKNSLNMAKLSAYEIDRRVTALQAQALVNDFLSNSLPDRFTADPSEWVDDKWQVPVILAYPQIGSLGSVGVVEVDTEIGAILSHTPIEQMKQAGIELYTSNRDAIEAAFL